MGIKEFQQFADDIGNVSDGLSEAKQNALEQTAKDFKRILKDVIINTNTAQGGTLHSETSPYSAGGENESTRSTKHLRNMGSWRHEIVGDDHAVIFPDPEIFKRASWLEYGTDDHGPSGDTPMYFNVNGATIVVADSPDDSFEGYTDYWATLNSGDSDANTVDALFENGEPGEVSGVEPQGFFKKAYKIADNQDIYKENLEQEIEELFAKNELPLEEA